jgi:steroid 5-alpha reductase family enzyme
MSSSWVRILFATRISISAWFTIISMFSASRSGTISPVLALLAICWSCWCLRLVFHTRRVSANLGSVTDFRPDVTQIKGSYFLHSFKVYTVRRACTPMTVLLFKPKSVIAEGGLTVLLILPGINLYRCDNVCP